jgi:hypothetical protein
MAKFWKGHVFGTNADQTHTKRTPNAHLTHVIVRLVCVCCVFSLGMIWRCVGLNLFIYDAFSSSKAHKKALHF